MSSASAFFDSSRPRPRPRPRSCLARPPAPPTPPRPSASPGEPGAGLADASPACRGKAPGPSPDLGGVPRGGPASPHTHWAPREHRDRSDSYFLPLSSCLTATAHLRLRPGECHHEHNSLFLACLQGSTTVRGLLFLSGFMVGTRDPQS